HAQVGSALAVDLHAPLRAVEPQGRIGVHDATELRRAAAQPLAVVGQSHEIRSADDEVDVEGAAADVEARDVANRHPDVPELSQTLADLLDDVALADVAAEGGHRLAAERRAEQAAQAPDAIVVRGH